MVFECARKKEKNKQCKLKLKHTLPVRIKGNCLETDQTYCTGWVKISTTNNSYCRLEQERSTWLSPYETWTLLGPDDLSMKGHGPG